MAGSLLVYITRFARHIISGTCPLPYGQKTTIYDSGTPRNSSLSTKVKRFAFKACLRCMGGDISVVVASASRRPRTSPCLVNVSSRPAR